MGKTYFNIADQLNFNGNDIKIKGKATKPLERRVPGGSVVFAGDPVQIYQSVTASQPQMCSVEAVNGIPPEICLGVMNSSPQAAGIRIAGNEKDGYTVKTSVSFQVSMRNTSLNLPRIPEIEYVVVSGLQVEGKHKYQFIEAALHDIDVMIEEGVCPSDITWLVFWFAGVYEDYDRTHFEETADTLGIKLIFIEDKKAFINYINYKNLTDRENGRKEIKIKEFVVFGHGQNPRVTGGEETQLSFGYGLDRKFGGDLEKNINFVQSDIEEIQREAFAVENFTWFYTCNTGTADENGLRFAQLWANKTRGNTYALKNARSNYTFMNSIKDEINVEFTVPVIDKDVAISDYINGAREVGIKWTVEVFLKFIDEEDRKAVELISEFMAPWPVSEEWKIKRKRKWDRERVDSDGQVYGYSDQGSLHYPTLNFAWDDRDIIKEAFLDKNEGNFRGFELFVPE